MMEEKNFEDEGATVEPIKDLEDELSRFVYKHRGGRCPFGLEILTVGGDKIETTFYRTDTQNVHAGRVSWIYFSGPKTFVKTVAIEHIASVVMWHHHATPQLLEEQGAT
ncbi:hypothetical protein [Tateyamaria sp. SN6-1]|uniref:hypothetical protein n=1 Tax=Tateyamaria sp. SN6-1 TaxID=3092148 RepID=UPI0039F579EE